MLKYLLLLTLLPFTIYADIYKVKRGDSLWKIAKFHKISLRSLRKLNEIYSDNVFVGQKIIIPNDIIDYEVKTGDTFIKIANKFDIPLNYIIMMNNISENQTIEGQKLKIPILDRKPLNTKIIKNEIKPIVYKVRSGDTLSDVSLKYNIPLPKLKQLNNKNNNNIYIGEQLIVGNQKIIINSPKQERKLSVHTVRSGETLGEIALKYNVSINNIKDWNNKFNTRIYRNEKIKIYLLSNIGKSTKPNYRILRYTVQRGENLSLIAAKFKVKTKDIKLWNKKINNLLFIGETLTIKVKKVKGEGDTTTKTDNTRLIRYKVRRGDSIDAIANRYKVSRSQILAWNKKRSTKIYIGEYLNIHTPKYTPRLTKKSKKAQYIQKKSSIGIKSNRFSDIPLPIKFAQVVNTHSSGRGAEIELKSQSDIIAPADGTVQYAGYINALQNIVIVNFSNKRTIVYGGLSQLNIATGQNIQKGQILGVAGKLTIDKSPKIYIEIRDNNKVANIFHIYKDLNIMKK